MLAKVLSRMNLEKFEWNVDVLEVSFDCGVNFVVTECLVVFWVLSLQGKHLLLYEGPTFLLFTCRIMMVQFNTPTEIIMGRVSRLVWHSRMQRLSCFCQCSRLEREFCFSRYSRICKEMGFVLQIRIGVRTILLQVTVSQFGKTVSFLQVFYRRKQELLSVGILE